MLDTQLDVFTAQRVFVVLQVFGRQAQVAQVKEIDTRDAQARAHFVEVLAELGLHGHGLAHGVERGTVVEQAACGLG